jgi:micrococcal nuclease
MPLRPIDTPGRSRLPLTYRLLVALAITTAGCASNAAAPTSTNEASVVLVVDGDTVRLRIADTTETVRLIGVDTPETKHPTKGVQCYGPQATQFLAQLLPVGSVVRIERDVEARDAYRRLLLYLYVTVNGTEVFVNRELVVRGFARPLDIAPNSRYGDVFVTAAFDAQQNARGLWKWCK